MRLEDIVIAKLDESKGTKVRVYNKFRQVVKMLMVKKVGVGLVREVQDIG